MTEVKRLKLAYSLPAGMILFEEGRQAIYNVSAWLLPSEKMKFIFNMHFNHYIVQLK